MNKWINDTLFASTWEELLSFQHEKVCMAFVYMWEGLLKKTLPKAQRTRGLSSAYQSNKFLHKSWSNSKIQNLNQTSAFRPNFNFKILTKQPLHNVTKPQQQNTDQTSVSKFRLNFNFKLLTKPCAQSLKFKQNFETESLLVFCCWGLVRLWSGCLVKILKLKFGRNADIWLRFWILEFDQDLCKNLLLW